MCKDNKEKNVGLLMAMSGDIFACHSVGRGCSWPVVGRTRDTTEHSTMQRTISTAFLHPTKKKKKLSYSRCPNNSEEIGKSSVR